MYTIIAKDKVLIYWFVPDIMYIYTKMKILWKSYLHPT